MKDVSVWKEDASLTRRCSSGKPACPYELRLIHFTLVTKPSTLPLLLVRLHPLATASTSSASPSTKAKGPLITFGSEDGVTSLVGTVRTRRTWLFPGGSTRYTTAAPPVATPQIC